MWRVPRNLSSSVLIIAVIHYTGAEGSGWHHQEGEWSPSCRPEHSHSSQIWGQKCSWSLRCWDGHLSSSWKRSVYSLYVKGIIDIMQHNKTGNRTWPPGSSSSLNPACVFLLVFQHVCITSGAIAGGPEAPNTLGDDPWLVAAPHEAAALPQSLQGLLRPVWCSHELAEVRASFALHQAISAVLW